MNIKTVSIVVGIAVGGIAVGVFGMREFQKRQQVAQAERAVQCTSAEKNVMRLVTLAHAGRYGDAAVDDGVKAWAESPYEPTKMTAFEVSVAKALVARREAWKDFVPAKKLVYGYGYTDDYNSLIPVVKPLYKEICMSM